MKRRIIALALVTAMSFSLMACGEKKTEETNPEEKVEKQEAVEDTSMKIAPVDISEKTVGYNVLDYVTLGDYKGIEVELKGDYEYTEEGYTKYVDSLFTDDKLYVKDDSVKEVAADSVVNVDYVGKKDNKAFEGGSAEDVVIDVAANASIEGTTYIEGFTKDLAGAKVGDTIDSKVTFPKEYQSAELAGQEVVFTFTVNYVMKKANLDAMTMEQKATQLGYDSFDEFTKETKKSYEDKLKRKLDSDTRMMVIDTVCKNASVEKYPQEILDARMKIYIDQLEAQSNQYGATLEEFVKMGMGIEYDEYEKMIREELEDSYKQELVFEAVARTEKMTLEDKEYEEYITSMIQSSNGMFSNVENMYQMYATPVMSGETYTQLQAYSEKGLKFCIDNAKVTK